MQAGTLVSAYSLAVTWRQYVVWRKLIWSSLVTNVANPLLFLFAAYTIMWFVGWFAKRRSIRA